MVNTLSAGDPSALVSSVYPLFVIPIGIVLRKLGFENNGLFSLGLLLKSSIAE